MEYDAAMLVVVAGNDSHLAKLRLLESVDQQVDKNLFEALRVAEDTGR